MKSIKKKVPNKLYGCENPIFSQNYPLFRNCVCAIGNYYSNFTKLCNCHFLIKPLYHAKGQHDLNKSGHQPHPSKGRYG